MLKLNVIQIILILLVLVLFIISINIVASASVDASEVIRTDMHGLSVDHIVRVALAFFIMFIISYVPYHVYKKLTLPGILFVIVLLVAQLIWGVAKKGAVRSIGFGWGEFQASFVAIYALIFHLANLVERKGEKIKNFKIGYLPMIMWISIITILIFAQPNFSQGMVVFATGLMMIFVGGGSLKHIFSTIFSSSPFILIYLLSADYRYQRIVDHLTNINQQVKYSLVAMGSGGLLGVGFGNSRFREAFISECYGDFIFSILGEEIGFLGVMFVLVVYLAIILLGLVIIRKTPDVFGKMVVSGIIIVLATYIIVNTFVVTGLMPSTGLPLPFMSYGGSALIMHSAAIGVMINIASNIKSVEKPEIIFNDAIKR